MTTPIPKAAVEAATKVFVNLGWQSERQWDSFAPSLQDDFRRQMRAALTAARPHIEADESERIAAWITAEPQNDKRVNDTLILLADALRRGDHRAATIAERTNDDTFCPDKCDHWDTGSECPHYDDTVSDCICESGDGVTTPKCPSCLADTVSDGEREGLLDACDPIDHHIAGDGLPAMRVRSRDEIAARVDAAGYRKPTLPSVEDMAKVLVEHTRISAEKCYCGWGELGRSHAKHVATAVLALFNPKEES